MANEQALGGFDTMLVRFQRFVVLILGVAALVVSRPAICNETSDAQQREENAVKQVIANWDRGWKDFDADVVSRDYAEDAEWTNAFGISRKGRTDIRKFLAELFLQPGIRSRKSTPSTTTLRFIRPDIAVASSYRETVGQKTASGAEYSTRKTHDLRVLVLANGRWSIISHLIMDEKETRP